MVPGAPISLKNGKPSWGAAADYTPSMPSAASPAWTKTKTCYYWAMEGKCSYSEEQCKYLHAHTGTAIAARPFWKVTPKKWELDTWKKPEEGSDEGDSVLDKVKDEGSAWGDVSACEDVAEGNAWGGDKYKPPHVVALNNKVLAS
jgi:hypothetical protein